MPLPHPVIRTPRRILRGWLLFGGLLAALTTQAAAESMPGQAAVWVGRFGGAVDRYEAVLQRFADKLHTGLSRELDRA